MAALTVAMRRAVQPQYACGVDWGNSLTRGLAGLYLPQGICYHDAVSNNLLTPSSTTSVVGVVSQRGRSVNRAASSGVVTFTPPASGAIISCATAVIDNIVADGFGNPQRIVGNSGGNGTDVTIAPATNAVVVSVNFATVTSQVLSGANNVVTIRRSSTTSEIWVNGVQATSVGHASFPLFSVFNFSWATLNVPLLAYHSRFLTDAEIAALAANPWQLFNPKLV